MIDLNYRFFSILFIFLIPFFAFNQIKSNYTLKILGVVQDGGMPHLGNNKTCCENIKKDKYVTSLMLMNNENNESFLFDASPDINKQLNFMGDRIKKDLKGIFLTHAHIGHYTGLMYFGREALNSKLVNVYAMPRMKKFLEENGPWSQLVSLQNISIIELSNESKISIDSNVIVQPVEVPHRAEFSETVGYKIYGPNKTALFIPDIDKWSKWQTDIIDIVENSDYSLLDGTFYDINELPGRDMSQIPHPFIIETMKLFKHSDKKDSIYFIHLNHTNPALNKDSLEYKKIIGNGFNITERGNKLSL